MDCVNSQISNRVFCPGKQRRRIVIKTPIWKRQLKVMYSLARQESRSRTNAKMNHSMASENLRKKSLQFERTKKQAKGHRKLPRGDKILNKLKLKSAMK